MLKSLRVTLRPMREADVPRQVEFNHDVELFGLDATIPRTTPSSDALAFYQARSVHDPSTSPFAIEADNKYIGHCALFGLNNRIGSAELGIMIGDRAYQGKGYGRETIKLLLHFGFHYLGVRRISLTTHAKNDRAIQCYARCGFIEEGRPRQAAWIQGQYVDLVEMAILRHEWLDAQGQEQ
jgi:RimJ/RimL family protein N-acetyltransferase